MWRWTRACSWNQYCLIVLSIVWGGRAVPLLWRVIEHKSASVSSDEYLPMRTACPMVVACLPRCDAAGRSGQSPIMRCSRLLNRSRWHWCIRLPSDVCLHGINRFARTTTVGQVYPPVGEAALYRNIKLWNDGIHRCNLVLAHPVGVDEARSL